MSINYDDVILKQLREYMTNKNESIVFYLIFKFGANEIKYMNPDDIEKFYDDIFNLMTSKITKIKCLC